jgi:hypothetical protein
VTLEKLERDLKRRTKRYAGPAPMRAPVWRVE